MAKNLNKRVSISFMDKVLKEMNNTVTKPWFGADVTIRRFIPVTDMIEMVDEVVSCCFLDDGSYHPEMKDFVLRSNVLTRYANFTLPEKLEHKYELVYGTDAYDFVMESVNADQYSEIVNAIDEKLSYLCDVNVTGLEQKMYDAVEAFNQLQDKLTGMFDGVTNEDIVKVAAAVVDGKFSEERLVQAYAEQMKRDANESGE